MLETVKLVAQRLIAPREPRLLDTQCPTDSCRKHWEMAPFLARLVVMKRWKSLSRLTFPPVMDMGKITGAWERSKDKGKLPPPRPRSYRWVASRDGNGGGATFWRGCGASSGPLCDGAVTSYSDISWRRWISALLNPLPYWLCPMCSTPIS